MRILPAEYEANSPFQKRSEFLGCLGMLFVAGIADAANRTEY